MQSLFIIVLREIKADGRKIHSIFFLILQKAKKLFLLFMYTNKSRPFTIPIIVMTKRSCFHCWKGNKSSLSSFKHSTFTMQPVHYHYKNNRSNIWTNTLLRLNMYNLCCLALSPYRREVMQHILFYVDIVRVNK